MSTSEKMATVVEQFQQNNPDFYLETANLLNPQELQQWDWSDHDPAQYLAQFKSYQRLYRLTGNMDDAQQLLDRGFTGASQIAQLSAGVFQQQLNGAFGGDVAKAEKVHQKAKGIRGNALLQFMDLQDKHGEQYQSLRVKNHPPLQLAVNTPQQRSTTYSFPSYEELFGQVTDVEAANEQSIYSPAAYFVDLMNMIGEHITEKNADIPNGLRLIDRRPDLWNDLALNSVNTNEEVRYLDLVVSIIESTLNNLTAEQLIVGANGVIEVPTEEHPTLDAAFKAASNNDNIIVRNSMTVDALDAVTKNNLTLRSLTGMVSTVLTFKNSSIVLKQSNGVSTFQVQGLSFQGNQTLFDCDGLSTFEVSDCSFHDVTEIPSTNSHTSPGVIKVSSSSTANIFTFSNCFFSRIASNVFSPSILYGDRAKFEFTRCTFVDCNGDVEQSASLFNVTDANGILNVKECIFWHTHETFDIYAGNSLFEGTKGVITLENSNVQEQWQPLTITKSNNTWVDPQFLQGATDYYDLKLTSPLYTYNNGLPIGATARSNVYKALSTAKYPFNMPFNLSQEQVYTYLKAANTTLGDVKLTITGVDPISLYNKHWAKAELQLSQEEYDLFTTPTYNASSPTDASNLMPYYGFTNSTKFNSWYNNGNIHVDDFLSRTMLTFDELKELLFQQLSSDERAAETAIQRTFFVNASEAHAMSINYDTSPEQVQQVTYNKLDHINRFVRLSRKLSWSFSELDWAVRSFGDYVLHFSGNSARAAGTLQHLDFDPNVPMTISIWMNPFANSGDKSMGVMKMFCDQDGQHGIGLQIDTNNNLVLLVDNVSETLYSMDNYNGQWIEVTIVYEGPSTYNFVTYLNGENQLSFDFSQSQVAGMNWNDFICMLGVTAVQTNDEVGFTGSLSNLRVWNTVQDVSDFGKHQFIPPQPSSALQLYYPMEEGSDDRLYDHSQHSQGTLTIIGYNLAMWQYEQRFEDANMINLAKLHKLKAVLGSTVVELSAFWHSMKTIDKVSDDQPQDLFDRVFNDHLVTSEDIRFEPNGEQGYDPLNPNSATATTDANMTSRLAGSLGISQSDLLLIVADLQRQLPEFFPLILNASTLTVLYRYAKLGQLLKLSVEDTLYLLQLTNSPSLYRFSIDALIEVWETNQWIQAAGLKYKDLYFDIIDDSEIWMTGTVNLDKLNSAILDFGEAVDDYLVRPDSFVNSVLDESVSALLHESFLSKGYIDEDGNVCKQYITNGQSIAERILFVPQSYPTIQQAIDNANDGDVVMVDLTTSGTDTANGQNINIDLKGKAIVLKSTNGPESSIIDCSASQGSRALNITSGAGKVAIIDGFTFTGGTADNGGVVKVDGDHPKFKNCVFTSNASNAGGAVYLKDSNAHFDNCLFFDNTSTSHGPAICVENGAPIVENSTFYHNISSNNGGAIYLNTTDAPTLNRSIVWNGEGVNAIDDVQQTAVVTACDFGTDNSGLAPQSTDSIHEDPLFLNAAEGNFILSADSPAINPVTGVSGMLGIDSNWKLQSFYRGQEHACLHSMGTLFQADQNTLSSIVQYFFLMNSDYNTYRALLPVINEVPSSGASIPVDFNGLPAVFNAYNLVVDIGLSSLEVENIFYNSSYFAINDISNLSLNDVRSLHYLNALSNAFPASDSEFINYFYLPDDEAKAAALSYISGWDILGINYLIEQQFDINTVNGLYLMQGIFELNASSGIDTPILYQLSNKSDFNTEDALNVFESLKVASAQKDWQKTAEAVNNQLAELKRNALVPYTINQINELLNSSDEVFRMHNADDLYQYLLIDVEMGGCMDTAPLIQGYLSALLYLQRCSLNLEPGVVNFDFSDEHWNWVQSYRVWEANRKMFLYPENYLDPSIRKDKTELFTNFENSLHQQEVNKDNVEEYYKAYANDFAEIADLSVVGAYADRLPVIDSCIWFLANNELSLDVLQDVINPTELTLECWVNMTTLDDNYDFLFEKDGDERDFEFELIDGHPKLVLRIGQGTSFEAKIWEASDITLTTNEWVHIAWTARLVENESGTSTNCDVALYVNGAVVGEKSCSPVTLSGTGLHFRCDADNTSSNTTKFLMGNGKGQSHRLNGQLTEIRWWKKALSKQEIENNLYQLVSDTDPNFSSLHAYYSFDDLMANKAIDKMGNVAQSSVLPASTAILSRIRPITTNDVLETTIYFVGKTRNTDSPSWYWRSFSYREVWNLNINQYERKDEFDHWGDWNKISLSINSNYASPAFYKNRLYLFWVEQQTSYEGSGEDTVQGTTAFIKGSYTNFNDGWEAPFSLSGEAGETVTEADKGKSEWQRVYPAINHYYFPQSLLVMYGPNTTYTSVQKVYSMSKNRVGVIPSSTLFTGSSAYTELAYLTQQNQNLGLTTTNNVLQCNFSGLQTTAPTTSLLAAAPTTTTGIPVYNLLGGFIIDVEDQDFLLLPDVASAHTAEVTVTAPNYPKTYQFEVAGGYAAMVDIDSTTVARSTFGFWFNPKLSEYDTTERYLAEFRYDVAGSTSLRLHCPDATTQNLYLKQNGGATSTVLNLELDNDNEWVYVALISHPDAQKGWGTEAYQVAVYCKRQWHYLAYDYTQGGNLDLYTLGGPVGMTAASCFIGGIAQLQIYDATLPKSILSNDDAYISLAPPSDAEGLLYYFPMTEGSGSSFGSETGTIATMYVRNLSGYPPQTSTWNTNNYYPVSNTPFVVTAANDYDALRTDNYSFIRLTTSAIFSLSDTLNADGLDGLLALQSQYTGEFNFQTLQPTNQALAPDDNNRMSFDFNDAYGLYYWEMFYYIPTLVAWQLNQNKQYEDAKSWFEYVFDPTQTAVPDVPVADDGDRYWRFRPLRYPSTSVYADLNAEVETITYQEDPFDPFAIAQLRWTAFQKSMVMQYVDNVLDWADNLYEQDTRETINEATMLYVLAENLLGDPPQTRKLAPINDDETYADILTVYGSPDRVPEFLLDAELLSGEGNSYSSPYAGIADFYFYIPANPVLDDYWQKVSDRLYKIRHCQNIDGIVQELSLLSPAIDPMQLARSLAAGGTATAALGGVNMPPPPYRFEYMLNTAKSVCSEVISFGGALLAALEKKDAASLEQLRASQETAMQTLVKTTKEQSIALAKTQVSALKESKKAAEARKLYYELMLVMPVSITEALSLGLNAGAGFLQFLSADIKLAAVPAYLIPDIFGLADGGMQFGDSANQVTNWMDAEAQVLNQAASMVGTMSGYIRRAEEWLLQLDLALHEIKTLDYQIAGAKLQQSIAESELNIQEKAIAQSEDIEQFLNDKFTNEELYQWMISRLSGLYFQSYQLAYNLALQAQKSYQLEQCTAQTFISPTNWDQLKKGLLAGEGLMQNLLQLEQGYLQQNTRTMEIRKTISLAQLNPNAFVSLIRNGECEFALDELDFDLDFPGHYQRQIKTISITIPAVVGPYQNINATLTQLSNTVVLTPNTDAVDYLLTGNASNWTPDGKTLRQDWRPNQQIAISTGVEDDGLFNLNFNDERYLPFEGTGAISRWRLSMPKSANRFDFATINDVIIKVCYTARDGGETFGNAVRSTLSGLNFQGATSLNLASQFSSDWYSFLHPVSPSTGNVANLQVTPGMFPTYLNGLTATSISMYLEIDPELTLTNSFPTLTLNMGTGTETFTMTNPNSSNKGVLSATVTGLSNSLQFSTPWVLDVTQTGNDLKLNGEDLLDPAKVLNIYLLVEYSASVEY